jgi:hypothetical protein
MIGLHPFVVGTLSGAAAMRRTEKPQAAEIHLGD